MAKDKSCRRAGSATRTVYTGGRPQQLKGAIYGSTPKQTVSANVNTRLGTRQTHVIGAPRGK